MRGSLDLRLSPTYRIGAVINAWPSNLGSDRFDLLLTAILNSVHLNFVSSFRLQATDGECFNSELTSRNDIRVRGLRKGHKYKLIARVEKHYMQDES